MNKIVGLGITALTIAGGSAWGQSASQIDRHVAEMRRFLHLSGRQAGAIRGDYFAASDEKRDINRNPNIGPFEKQRRIREVNRGLGDQIRAILSPRQLDAWQDWQARRRWEW